MANEAEPERVPLIGLANEIAVGSDGWALIPYGDHPNDRGLQPFGKTEAERMVGYFKNGWNVVKRAFVGMPILRGHPDMAKTVRTEMTREKDAGKRASLQSLINAIERRYPDKTVYGTIGEIEARENGLALKLVLTEEGEALVNDGGLKFFSPHWLCSDGAPAADGKPTKIPVYLVSIGLTDRPNIAGTSLVNEVPNTLPEPTETKPIMNKELVLALLAALSRPLAAEATDEQMNSALSEAATYAATLSARPEPTALANEQSRATQLTVDLAAANTALTAERAAMTGLVNSRNELLVGSAITAGRISEAQKPVWLGRLGRDFAVESVALANEASALKTTARTATLGDRKPKSAAGEKFSALVNERIAKGQAYTAAWSAVKSSTEGKALYAEMEKAPSA